MLLTCAAVTSVQARDIAGFEVSGYTRFGAYSSPAGTPRGSYTLGGDTQKFRLGNEGDNGIELGIGKPADISNGKKLGFMYMPVVWGGNYATAQGFVAISGFDFAPEARFWVGQNRLRLQEVHIVDSFLMDYGDNTGVGVTGLDLGFAKLGIGLFNSGTLDYSSIVFNNVRRINIDLSDIRTKSRPVPGGRYPSPGNIMPSTGRERRSQRFFIARLFDCENETYEERRRIRQ